MKAQTVRIHWMSGTGNSLRLAKWISEHFATRDFNVELTQIGAFRTSGRSDLAWLGAAFPTHGFTAPWAVLRWACFLPRGKGIPAFVLGARAGAWAGIYIRGLAGSSPWIVALILALKGYRVRGVLGVDMPANWTAVHPGLNAAHTQHFVGHGKEKVGVFAEKLLAGRRHLISMDNVFELIFGLALLPVSMGYLLFGRPLFAKLFFANERCNGCGLCAAHCPHGAIRMKAGGAWPYWTLHCENCMRCMNICPKRAVEAGHSLGLLLNLAAGLPVAAWLTVKLAPHGSWVKHVDRGFPQFAVNYAWYLSTLVAVYFAVFHLMRWRPIRLVFAYTTFTRWFRRYREPETSVQDLPGQEARHG